ncbi:hypothetical protein FH972_023761 [Carpinus fangiana]|uniref:Uncharacterized protein n=1 Tax=Carpinus fangiana TaxID=176857 RepID=A0A5N6KWI9_9ROSI|nr:hypothetical protein FH972_023761 [Carpinus fangiana]
MGLGGAQGLEGLDQPMEVPERYGLGPPCSGLSGPVCGGPVCRRRMDCGTTPFNKENFLYYYRRSVADVQDHDIALVTDPRTHVRFD